MAEQQAQERTEEATPRRREKLRDEGKVAKSPDVDAVLIVASVLATLAWNANANAVRVTMFARRAFTLDDADRPFQALGLFGSALGHVLGPVLVVAAVAAIAAGAVQTRGLFSMKLVAVKLERLDPRTHLKKILPGKEALTELGKQLLKVVAVGWVVWRVVAEATPMFSLLASVEPNAAAAAVGAVAAKLVAQGLAAFAVLAAFDWWLAFRRFQAESKMSRQDVRDEMKQEEGDPHLRARRRQRARDLVKQTLAEVRNATVVVVNPTHVSVALRYDGLRDAAPVLLAKGVDDLALRMRAEARRHGVPIVENRPLARALWAVGKVGKGIPVDLYEATAMVIAHVLRLQAERRAGA